MVTKLNLEFGIMCKYPFKCNFSVIGLNVFVDPLISYHLSEFGTKKKKFKKILIFIVLLKEKLGI